MVEEIMTGLGEECGVFGAYDLAGDDVASYVYTVCLPYSTGDSSLQVYL